MDYRIVATGVNRRKVTRPTSSPPEYNLAIAGAGLAGGLIALACAKRQPDLRIALVDAAEKAGGNHIWSFFDSDVSEAGYALLDPLISHRWDKGHEVRFPGFSRHLATRYNSISSAHFHERLQARLGDGLILRRAASQVTSGAIVLTDGTTINARAVVDARGFPAGLAEDQECISAPMTCGWQKFVGQVLRLAAPHGLDHPVIMDACVDQGESYRFIYLLPLAPDEIFVEDTYYGEEPELDSPAVRGRIADYTAKQGWQITTVMHEEAGLLPVVTGGDFDCFWPAGDLVARAGVRAGLFHPTTGYSLPMATEFALAIAGQDGIGGTALARFARTWAHRHWRGGRYYRMLGRMLFDAALPEERYRIFERFYRLPSPLIARFYAGRSTRADKIRILCGKPPVPIRAAMQALIERQRA